MHAFPPPEHFLTHQAIGPYLLFPQLLDDLDLLRELEAEASSDPNVLKGTSCCLGVVEGTVRVVKAIEETAVSGTYHSCLSCLIHMLVKLIT